MIRLSHPTPDLRPLPVHYVGTNGVAVSVLEARCAEEEESQRSGIPTVTVRRTAGEPAYLVVSAEVKGAPLAFDAERRPVVPSVTRAAAEAAIDEFADLLSVLGQCRRSVMSPTGATVSLELERSEAPLSGSTTAEQTQSALTRPRVIPLARIEALSSELMDRSEGVSLLASCLSDPSALGMAREVFRLFEAAFGGGIDGLRKQLHNFLRTTPHSETMTFRMKEIDSWVRARGPIMHADRRIASARDVAEILPRLQWAAYDVLLNKKTWGTGDWERRSCCRFSSGVSLTGAVLRFDDESPEILVQNHDQYGIYPRFSDLSITAPDGHFCDARHDGSYSPVLSAVGQRDTEL